MPRFLVINDDNKLGWRFLLLGQYRVNIAALGLRTQDRKGITLSASDVKPIDTTIEFGAASQTVGRHSRRTP